MELFCSSLWMQMMLMPTMKMMMCGDGVTLMPNEGASGIPWCLFYLFID